MERDEFLLKTGAGIATAVTAPFAGNFFVKRLSQKNMQVKLVRNKEGEKLNVLGDNMTVKLTGEATDGQYVFIEENNEPGIGIPLHVHEHEDEIFRVAEGHLEVQVADMKTVLGPGDMAFCPRAIPHAWRVVGDKTATVHLSVFPAGLEEMFKELSQLPEGPPDMGEVTRICGEYGVKFV